MPLLSCSCSSLFHCAWKLAGKHEYVEQNVHVLAHVLLLWVLSAASFSARSDFLLICWHHYHMSRLQGFIRRLTMKMVDVGISLGGVGTCSWSCRGCRQAVGNITWSWYMSLTSMKLIRTCFISYWLALALTHEMSVAKFENLPKTEVA